MSNEFKIKISIDGQDAQAEIGKLRSVLELALGHVAVEGHVDIQGLEDAQARMAALRKDAGNLGRAITQGLGQQWENLEARLTTIQSHISGIVRAGGKVNIAADMLDAMPELEQTLSANDKKTLDLTLKMQDLTARTGELTRSIAELGRVRVEPLSGGQVRTLSELFKGLSEPYTKGKVKKAVKAIDTELAPMEKEIDDQLSGAIDALNVRREELRAAIDKTTSEMARLQESKPPVSTVIGVDLTAEQRAWQDLYDDLLATFETQNRELDAVRSEIFQGDAQEMRDKLLWRRRELEKPLEEEFTFWREWSMNSIEEISNALRATGQSAAAEALGQMEAAFTERKRLQTQIKRAYGGLQQGGQAELPENAQGTLVDFISAERALGEIAGMATEKLDAQTKALTKKVKAFDLARRAGEGFNETERKAVAQLEKAAQREVRRATPARVGLEDAAAAEKEILGRLAVEVQGVSKAMEDALAAPLSEESEQKAKGLLRLWEWVADKLVGHSVIPDMVQAINQWLSLIGEDTAQQDREQIVAAELKARALIDLAKQEMQVQDGKTRALIEMAEKEMEAQISAEKRLTIESKAQARIRLAQKQEAAKRVTIRQRATSGVAVESGKAQIREQERQAKLLGQAKTLAGEIGIEWAEVQEIMAIGNSTLEATVGQLKRLKRERAAANRVAQQQTRLEAEAQRLTASLGLSWTQVTDAMQDSGAELDSVLRELQQVEHKQRAIADQVREIDQHYGKALRTVGLFTSELNDAREARRGLFDLSRDAQEIGNSLRMHGAIVTGAEMVAGRDYVTFAKQSDTAARSLTLSADMTKELRERTIEQSAALAVLNPEETARGVTVWAQATGQQVDTQRELNQLLAETIPIQQASALSQTDVVTLSDATAGALNQYGLAMSDTTRVVAIFNKVSDDTLAEVGDVAEGFKMVGPSAQRARESIETTAVAFSILGDNNIRGTMAGTSYGKMLDNLLVPKSEEAEEVLDRTFGSSSAFYNAEGEFVGTARAVDMLSAALETMNDQEREATLSALFDTNAKRAATVLIREQTEARKEGINVLQAEAEGLSENALQVWKQQLSDWEQSDVYRVQQAQMRWQAFWLTVGEQGLDMALPYLESGSKMIEELVQTVKANPWMTKVVTGVATGAIAVGTLITAVGTVSKIVLSLQTLTAAYKSTILKQQTAEARFRGAVVSSAEQFRTIITQAATQAAATENTGAHVENSIEAQGAMQESAIEAQSAFTEGLIEQSTSIDIQGILTTLGATLAKVVAPIAGIFAGGSIYDWLVENEIGPYSDSFANLEQFATVGAYGVGKLFGGEELGLKYAETMGNRVGAFDDVDPNSGGAGSGTPSALQGLMDTLQEGFGITGDGEATSALQRMMGAITEGFDDTTEQIKEQYGDLYQHDAQEHDVVELLPEQENAVEAYIDLLKRQEEAVESFNDQVADAARELQTDLAQLWTDYERNRAETEADFQNGQVQQQEEYHRRQAQAAADHQKKMARMEEDHYARLWDFSLSRDAAGMVKEQRSYSLERRRAEEDFADDQQRGSQEFAREQAERAQQHAIKMEEMAINYEEEKQARQEAHAEQVTELERERQETLDNLRQEYFERINEELNYYSQSEEQQAAYHAALLRDAEGFLSANHGLWLDYVRSLPTPSKLSQPLVHGGSARGAATGEQGYALGGYVRATDRALVHRGEFVLNAQTTRQVEGNLGFLSQSKIRSALSSSGPQITLPLTIHQGEMHPREVARLAGAEVERRLVELLQD